MVNFSLESKIVEGTCKQAFSTYMHVIIMLRHHVHKKGEWKGREGGEERGYYEKASFDAIG